MPQVKNPIHHNEETLPPLLQELLIILQKVGFFLLDLLYLLINIFYTKNYTPILLYSPNLSSLVKKVTLENLGAPGRIAKA